ncbi:uncharacterized protein [Malus domestica]|uniref:uncharacterized protein isoform X4 n=1 Tax=Malus domestica TaxID=3750 RepID=UPI003976AD12
MPRGSTPNNFSFFSLCPPVNLSFLPSSFSFSVFLSLLLGSHFSPFSAPQAHTHRGTRVCEEEPSPFTISSCSLSLSLSFPRPQKTGKRTPARFFNLRLGNGTALFLFLAPTYALSLSHSFIWGPKDLDGIDGQERGFLALCHDQNLTFN